MIMFILLQCLDYLKPPRRCTYRLLKVKPPHGGKEIALARLEEHTTLPRHPVYPAHSILAQTLNASKIMKNEEDMAPEEKRLIVQTKVTACMNSTTYLNLC